VPYVIILVRVVLKTPVLGATFPRPEWNSGLVYETNLTYMLIRIIIHKLRTRKFAYSSLCISLKNCRMIHGKLFFVVVL